MFSVRACAGCEGAQVQVEVSVVDGLLRTSTALSSLALCAGGHKAMPGPMMSRGHGERGTRGRDDDGDFWDGVMDAIDVEGVGSLGAGTLRNSAQVLLALEASATQRNAAQQGRWGGNRPTTTAQFLTLK